jgi:hypothetical protein
MIVAGIDPGQQGAITLFDGVEMTVFDLVRTDGKDRTGGGKKPLNVATFMTFIQQYKPEIVWCENFHFIDQKTANSISKVVYELGQMAAVCALEGVEFKLVDPKDWKGSMCVTSDKDGALRFAKSIYPNNAHDFTRADRAESAMIADYGYRVSNRDARIRAQEAAA